jgi:hypothetical protein
MGLRCFRHAIGLMLLCLLPAVHKSKRVLIYISSNQGGGNRRYNCTKVAAAIRTMLICLLAYCGQIKISNSLKGLKIADDAIQGTAERVFPAYQHDRENCDR